MLFEAIHMKSSNQFHFVSLVFSLQTFKPAVADGFWRLGCETNKLLFYKINIFSVGILDFR